MSFYEFTFLVLSEETYYGLLANDIILTLMIYLATLYFPVTISYLTKQYHTRQLHDFLFPFSYFKNFGDLK